MQYGIPHATLRRHSLDKVRQPGSKTLGRPCAIEPAEAEFAKHVLYMESIWFGLTPKNVREIAYEYWFTTHSLYIGCSLHSTDRFTTHSLYTDCSLHSTDLLPTLCILATPCTVLIYYPLYTGCSLQSDGWLIELLYLFTSCSLSIDDWQNNLYWWLFPIQWWLTSFSLYE